jgi:hypothetical protein
MRLLRYTDVVVANVLLAAGPLWIGLGDPEHGWYVAAVVAPAVGGAYMTFKYVRSDTALGRLWTKHDALDQAHAKTAGDLQATQERQDRLAANPSYEQDEAIMRNLGMLPPQPNTGGISTAVVPEP